MPGGGINPQFPTFVSPDERLARGLNDMADQIRAISPQQCGDNMSWIQNGAGFYPVPVRRPRELPFYNPISSQIPAYGITLLNGMQANGDNGLYKIKQPDTFGCQTNWLINGPGSCDVASYGLAQAVYGSGVLPGLPGFIVAYDSADGTPAFGDRWGPRSGTWLLKKNTGGFVVQGVYDATNHLALVIPEPMTIVRGKLASDLASGANTGTLTVWSGAFGSEATTSQTISGILNDSSCTVKGTPQFCTVYFVPLNNGWQAVVGRTS